MVEYQGKRHFLKAVYDYPNVDMRHPDEKAQINRFLGGKLDVAAMTAAVDGSLYRNRVKV